MRDFGRCSRLWEYWVKSRSNVNLNETQSSTGESSEAVDNERALLNSNKLILLNYLLLDVPFLDVPESLWLFNRTHLSFIHLLIAPRFNGITMYTILIMYSTMLRVENNIASSFQPNSM